MATRQPSGTARSTSYLTTTAYTSGAAALLAILVIVRRRLLDSNDDNNGSNGKRRGSKKNFTPINTPQIEAAQRELYQVRPDGSRVLLVPSRNGTSIAKVVIRPVKESTYARHRKSFIAQSENHYDNNNKKSTSSLSKATLDGASSSTSSSQLTTGSLKPDQRGSSATAATGQSANQAAKKVAVNKEFLRQLRAILQIIFPR